MLMPSRCSPGRQQFLPELAVRPRHDDAHRSRCHDSPNSSASSDLSFVDAPIGARSDLLHPNRVVDVPFDRGLYAPFVGMRIAQPKAVRLGIDRISAVIATVRNMPDQGSRLAERLQNRRHDLQIRSLVAAADVVTSLPARPRVNRAMRRQWSSTNSQSRTFSPSPYTGSGLPSSGVQDHQRNQLLGKLGTGRSCSSSW